MEERYWTLTEVMEILDVDEAFLQRLEREEIVCCACREMPSVKEFSAGEMEKLRLAKLLVEEMDVNMSGVEIILRMRQSMIEMRRQFDAILEDMAKHLRDVLRTAA